MKNKTWTCLVVVSAALLMAGCGSRTKKQTNEECKYGIVSVNMQWRKDLATGGSAGHLDSG